MDEQIVNESSVDGDTVIDVIDVREPTGNLDSKTTGEIIKIFSDLHKQGRTIVMITHDPEIAEFANRLVLVKDGLIAQYRSGFNQHETSLNDLSLSIVTEKPNSGTGFASISVLLGILVISSLVIYRRKKHQH